MKDNFKTNSITKRKLAFMISVVIVLISIGSYFIYKQIVNKINYSNEKIHSSIATLKVKKISNWFFDEKKDIQIIANHPFLTKDLINFLSTNLMADKSELTKVLKQIKKEHDYESVIISTLDGKILAKTAEQIEVLNDIEQSTIAKAYVQDNAHCTDIFKTELNGEEKTFISFISLIKGTDNNVLAALIGRIDAPRYINPLIEDWPIPSQTAESFLFRVESDSIVYLNNLQHINSSALNLRIPVKKVDLLASQAASGKLGLLSGKDYRDEDVTGYAAKIEGTSWYLISKIDDSEMYEGKYVIAGISGGIGILLIFIVTFFVAYVYKQRQMGISNELHSKEKEVWQQQEKFKVTMDSLGEGVIVTDMDAKIQYMNIRAEAMTGWRYREARGRYLGEVYPVKNEETGEKENNILEKVIKHGIVKELANHTLLVTKNGEEIPVMDTGAPIYDTAGSLTGIVISFQDETEKRLQTHLLKESEESLREFFEYDISGDYSATADGELLRCNPAFAEILGYNSPDELIGRKTVEFYKNPDERDDLLKIIRDSKILKDYEINLKHKDGSDLFCLVNIVGVFDKSGTLEKYFGYLQNITQRKRAEENLHIREQLLTAVMDTQQELICRFLPDTTITFVNKAYCKLFGKTETELIGSKFLQFVPESEKDYELSILRSLNTNNPQRTNVSKAFRADGSEITLEFTDTAIFNEKDELVEFQSVGRDITEKLKAEQEIIQHSEIQSMLRTIASSFINIPLEFVDKEIQSSLKQLGHFVKADRVYIFDYDWFKNSCSNTFEWCQDGIEPQIQVLQNVPIDEIPQWVNPHRNGKVLHIPDVFKLDINDGVRQILEPQGIKSLLTVPIMGDNECIGFLGFDSVRKHHSYTQSEEELLSIFAQLLSNIKYRQILESSLVLEKEKAEESDKLKTAFINNISHEVRTPLNGIMGFGQFLVGSDLSEEERREYYGYVEKSSNRLMNTVSDYIDMAMLVSNSMKVNKKEFALKPVFETITEKAKKLCSPKNIEFEVLIPIESTDLNINSDYVFLQKILDKLLDNAIKFTQEGSITCSYSIKTGYIEFLVKDTGCGIDNDAIELIFDMFRQENSSMTRGYEGSGLGLAIAKGLVKLLDGKIYVYSEKEKGSEFIFTIPIENPKKSISFDATNGNKTKTNHKPKILIAEDDKLNFIYMETVIKSLGYNYIHAVNGLEAVDYCKQNADISIVLMDIKMPVMNGVEATTKIREFSPELPIIATTAHAQTEDKYRFLEAGCTDYISKPIEKDKLLHIIKKYVE